MIYLNVKNSWNLLMDRRAFFGLKRRLLPGLPKLAPEAPSHLWPPFQQLLRLKTWPNKRTYKRPVRYCNLRLPLVHRRQPWRSQRRSQNSHNKRPHRHCMLFGTGHNFLPTPLCSILGWIWKFWRILYLYYYYLWPPVIVYLFYFDTWLKDGVNKILSRARSNVWASQK